MKLTFRAKLVLIVVAAVLSGAAATGASALIGLQQNRDLADVEERLVPRLELSPRVSADFARLRRSMQDAVAAEDAGMLAESATIEQAILQRLDDAGAALDREDARSLRDAIEAYYSVAHGVSERLIAGEAGEAVVNDMARMQAEQARVERLIEKSLELDGAELERGFAAVRGANQRADQLRLAIGLAGLLLVMGLSYWLSRSLLRALQHLSWGFARFATGDFERPIPTKSTQDLEGLTRAANKMAESLKTLVREREDESWLKAGQAGLSDELRGEPVAVEMAMRALNFFAQRIQAVAGAVYLTDESGSLVLLAGLGRKEGDLEHAGTAWRAAPGEGLVGRAALARDVVVVEDVPPEYLKLSSGLGEASPGTLVFLPLTHGGTTVGVVELAFFGACSERALELLRATRETLTLAFEAARSRADLEGLLFESREQAERLAAQEEELRVSNGDLQAQQEELRLANDELEKQRRALHENNAVLEDARRHLQEKAAELARVSEYKSQFLANMSHELRTPLNSMLLLAHLLGENQGGHLTPKQVEHCKTIHGAGKDLLGLIDQILDLAKIEAGRQQLSWQPVPLEHFATFVSRRFGETAKEKGLTLVTRLDPELPSEMVTDIPRMERILTNLVGNAIKFTERGSVTLRITKPAVGTRFAREDLQADSTLAFLVSDTGAGIDPRHHDKIFKPFEQADETNERRYGGTGLGLAIVRESLALLGGEVQLQSAIGRGSTFSCYLPVRAAEAELAAGSPEVSGAGSALPAGVGASGPVSTPASEPKLLLIEDDPVLLEQLVDVIRARRLGALVARSGRAGLELALEPGVVGIVLDVRLPDMDGWKVMERLRQDVRTREIPVHFVTAVDKPERGLALGAVGYLVKPVTHADLANVVFTLAGSNGSRPRLLVVEDDVVAGQSIAELLRSEDVEIKHVTNARDALAAVRTGRFGCMILDLGLPDMDGLQLLEAVSADAGNAAPRVVVHTGRSLTRQETRQLESYAQAVILKEERSAERLREEVRCFVKHLKDGLGRDAAPVVVGEAGQSAELSLANVKLLLAEDDMRTVYALSALMSGKGAEVLVAENGRQALELLRQHPDIQGVLMDIMMPEMDGYEAMRRIRREPRFAELPVIALTARAMKGERERCVEAGANEYLSKPVNIELLLATLARCLRKDAAVARS